MSAPLSKPLFHGTTENMKPGDIIRPTPQVISGLTEAYATHSYPEAYNYAGARAANRNALFGSVYEVEPVETDPNPQRRKSLLSDRFWFNVSMHSFENESLNSL